MYFSTVLSLMPLTAMRSTVVWLVTPSSMSALWSIMMFRPVYSEMYLMASPSGRRSEFGRVIGLLSTCSISRTFDDFLGARRAASSRRFWVSSAKPLPASMESSIRSCDM